MSQSPPATAHGCATATSRSVASVVGEAPHDTRLVGVDDVYDLFQRGTALLEAGHHHQAAIPLARARDLAPDKTSVREALGRALFHIQHYEEAAEEFRAVIERAPTNDYAQFCLRR